MCSWDIHLNIVLLMNPEAVNTFSFLVGSTVYMLYIELTRATSGLFGICLVFIK